MVAIKEHTVVKGGKVEVASQGLADGTLVEVIVLSEAGKDFSLSEIIGKGKGNFKSIEEVDQFINELHGAIQR